MYPVKLLLLVALVFAALELVLFPLDPSFPPPPPLAPLSNQPTLPPPPPPAHKIALPIEK